MDRQEMFAQKRLSRQLLIAALALAPMACASPMVTKHGHRLETSDLEQVKPGVTSREEVYRLLGSPSAVATFDGDRWYYISQRTEQKSFYQKDIVAQDVVAITFDAGGFVDNVETRDLAQAELIEPDPDKTRTLGNELTIVEQLVGNIGRFNTAEPGPAGVGRPGGL
jgi:outer membrane protein assembly factor BamE (lipoprotein component of BamABCDE complex)